jgi:thiol-disulfide isomerase/thioredoxin
MKTPPALRLAYTGFALIGIVVVAAYLRAPAGPTLTSADAPLTPPRAEAQAIPTDQPDFTLTGLDGKRHSIGEWSGHPKIVNFWATWCGPCRKEIPLLNRIQAEYQSKGLKIIGIAVDFTEDVRNFNAKTPLAYDILVGEEDATEAAKAFGVGEMALPFSAFVDSHGRVLTVHLGELHEADLRSTLAILLRLDNGELTPAAAQAALKAADTSSSGPAGTPH